MLTILKRELGNYFFTAVGYIIIIFLFMLSSIFFLITSVVPNSSNLNATFGIFFYLMMFFYPVLTMRLFSEERHKKTDQVLLTAPLKLSSIVLGKYLAALIMHLICISITLVFSFVIMNFTTPNWSVILTSFLGLFLIGNAIIAIGMFFSSLTENQIIAIFVTLPVNIVLLVIDQISNLVPVEIVSNFLKNLSFLEHYSKSFIFGMLSFNDLFFFVSITSVFIFLTTRVLEKRRWS